MSIGDQNKDNLLAREEFPRFVNPLSQNLYGLVPFNTLPLPVQLVFDEFADTTTDAIDVTGTRPGTQPTPERVPILTSLCEQTLVAIEVGQEAATIPPTEPPPAFVLSFQLCRTAMAASDLAPRDELLDSAEYARFLNIISGNRYPERNYDLLPELLQGNFVQYSNDVGAVPIAGSKPGLTPTAEQEASLRAFCDATGFILSELLSDSSSATASPTPGEVEAYPYTQCTLSMATSDGDRSFSLSPDEYVSFLNKMESFAWSDVAYNDLPLPLQINFEDLSKDNNGAISIAGSFPGTPPTDEERVFLERICFDTALSADASLYPNKYGIPADLNSTFTGNITIYNAFVLSTVTTSSVEEVLSSNETLYEDLLNSAYSAFVRQAVSTYESTVQTFAKYSIVESTEDIYLFEDTPCPENNRNLTLISCQIVYSMFQLKVRYETNVSKLEDELTIAMQSRLGDAAEGLESFLDALDPSSRLIVVGIPEDGKTQPSTSTPDPPPDPESEESSGGMGVGLLIGIIIGGALLCCCGAYFFLYGEMPDMSCPDMSGWFRRSSRSSKQNDTKDDDSDGGPAGFTVSADDESPKKATRQRDDDSSSHNFNFDDFRRKPTDGDDDDDEDYDEESTFRRRKQDSDEEGSQNDDHSGYGDSDSESDSNNRRKNTKGGRGGPGGSDSDSYGSDYSDGF